MLLSACTSHSSLGQSKVISSLAFNPAPVLTEEVNKSTQNKSAENRNAPNFCQVLVSLGQLTKLSVLHLPEKKKKTIGAILNKVLRVIHEAECSSV